MTELRVLAEGSGEQRFIEMVLSPLLSTENFRVVAPLVENLEIVNLVGAASVGVPCGM